MYIVFCLFIIKSEIMRPASLVKYLTGKSVLNLFLTFPDITLYQKCLLRAGRCHRQTFPMNCFTLCWQPQNLLDITCYDVYEYLCDPDADAFVTLIRALNESDPLLLCDNLLMVCSKKLVGMRNSHGNKLSIHHVELNFLHRVILWQNLEHKIRLD